MKTLLFFLGIAFFTVTVLLLSGCTTTTTTFPDGRVVKVSSFDALGAGTFAGAVAGGAAQVLVADRGFRK